VKALLSALGGPPGLVMTGAVLAALGAFWASAQKAQFEHELRLKSEELAELSKTTLAAVTGGDSFCYIAVSQPSPGTSRALAMVIHTGEHPLYDVSARLVDLDKFDGLKGQGTYTYEALNSTQTLIQLGTLIPKHAGELGRWDLNAFPLRGMNIFFTARNGGFTECLRVRRVGDSWAQAILVTREGGGTTLFEQVDAAFPREPDGKVDWK
jgi:hypothetical protein